MHLAILQSMTRAQRFRYDATRILHQDHAIENPAHGPPQQRRGSTMYDSYTPTDSVSAGKPSHTKVTGTLAQQNASPSSSSSSSLATSAIHPQQQLYQYYLYHQNPQLQQQLQKQHQQQLKEMAGGGRIQDRCQYWTAQANLLVTSMAVGTEFEPKSESDAQQEKDLGKELSPHKAAHASASVSRDSMPPQPPSYSADHTPSQNQNQSHNHDLDQDHDHDQSQDPDNVVSHLPAANTSSSTFTLASESSVSLASTSTAVPPENQTTSSLSFFARTFVLTPIPKTFNGKVEPLLMERFQSMVDLIFDPCLVPLSYRRAIINCARYVSADIDKIFPNAIETTILRVEPLEPVLLAHFTKICTIQLGPYLSMLTPNQFDEDGLELSLRAQQRLERTATSTIEPPKRLVNYFQMMLWHRCMHDLIVIYNKLQDRHTRSFEVSSSSVKQQKSSTTTTAAAASSLQPKPPVCCQDTAVSSSLSSTPTVPFSTYPFCCEAHSLVFTSPYPTSMVPYPLRLRFRRMAQKVQTVSQHALWLMAMGGMGQRAGSGLSSSFNMDTMPPDQNVIRNLGANNKIRFCNGSVHPPMISTSDNAISGHQQRQQSQHNPCQHDDEASLQRRYEIEERIRQDNKIKQELLGLCHMACGLFLIHTSTIHQHLHHHRRSPDAPPTIMSLLRYGSPWKKGIWREGEWRHDPIELGQASPTTMASGDSSRQHGSGRAKKNGQANLADQGPWQKMCIATIQFLAHEDLAWGGSRTNAELSRLRATSEANAWVYHE
ncbi:hypothetical protein BGZ94_007973 [Podila epigama]|nr:hypothetical protein BGZ94_007973 [Podila epigama]